MQLTDLKLLDYIGDGVYVGFDGYHIWLVTYNGINITNEVALEQPVLTSFIGWLERNKDNLAHD